MELTTLKPSYSLGSLASAEGQGYDLIRLQWNTLMIQQKVVIQDFWTTDTSAWESVFREADFGYVRSLSSSRTMLFALPFPTEITLGSDRIEILVAAPTLDLARAEIKKWRIRFPHFPSVDDRVSVNLWHLGSRGAVSRERRLVVPQWSDIKQNYAAKTFGPLDTLIKTFKPSGQGQLILWHGQPGGGKTFALRSLIRAWRNWCSCHVIVDPDVFLSSGGVDYLMSVLMAEDDDMPSVAGDSTKDSDKWRLLIMEDAGELLAPDARQVVGQALSRLLNLVDGILGQALNVMILITTNEPISKLHPAVSRPGRCAAKIEFGDFSKDEAALWLRPHGLTTTQPLTLAEMYNMVAEAKQIVGHKDTREVGFSGLT